jgi:hypothetical protein
MATTTPNFGWTVPTSSDLVKNGATAIETLGDAIDASMVDLKGGTSDQVLAKNSNTDMDFKWVTPAAGGGGKVLQVVNTTAGSTSSSTSTYVDHISLSITPTSASSKILVLFSSGNTTKAGVNRGLQSRLVRDATAILQITTVAARSDANENRVGAIGCNYLDSPATTSSTTYKVQINSYNNDSDVGLNPNDDRSTMTLMEIGA